MNFDCRCRKSSLPLFWASNNSILNDAKLNTTRHRLQESLTLFGEVEKRATILKEHHFRINAANKE